MSTTTIKLTDEAPAANPEVYDVLSNLISYCRDGSDGFAQAAEHATAPELVDRFRQYAYQRATFVADLQALEIRYGKASPDDSGSVTGALHRAWINIRTVVTTRDDQAILEEAERGEDAAVAAYRDAISKQENALPADVLEVLLKQAAQVKATHDDVRSLRDSGRYRKSDS
jgi:uncharacterized protein (TIGR02284 family)